MDNLKISGRNALKIAGEELDYVYDQLRHRDEELLALEKQVKILREEGEKRKKRLSNTIHLAEQTQTKLKDEINFWRSATMLMIVVVFAEIAIVRLFS